jgi:hypothetical protein
MLQIDSTVIKISLIVLLNILLLHGIILELNLNGLLLLPLGLLLPLLSLNTQINQSQKQNRRN